jgi:hypothetical protein
MNAALGGPGAARSRVWDAPGGGGETGVLGRLQGPREMIDAYQRGRQPERSPSVPGNRSRPRGGRVTTSPRTQLKVGIASPRPDARDADEDRALSWRRDRGLNECVGRQGLAGDIDAVAKPLARICWAAGGFARWGRHALGPVSRGRSGAHHRLAFAAARFLRTSEAGSEAPSVTPRFPPLPGPGGGRPHGDFVPKVLKRKTTYR